MAEQRFAQIKQEDTLARQLPLLKAAGVRVVDSFSLVLAPKGSEKNSIFIQYGKGIAGPVNLSNADKIRVKG